MAGNLIIFDEVSKYIVSLHQVGYIAEKDIEIIDSHLMVNGENKLYKLKKQFHCSKAELKNKIKERFGVLSQRPWTLQEDNMIIVFLNDPAFVPDLKVVLTC